MAAKEKEIKQLSSYKAGPSDFRITNTPFREVRLSPAFSDHFGLLFEYVPKILTQCLAFIPHKNLSPKDVDLYVDVQEGKVVAYSSNLVQPDAFSIIIGPKDYDEYKSSIRFGIEEETTRNTELDDAERSLRQIPDHSGMRSPYRKASELPDPSQPPGAEVNRTKRQVKLRLTPELIASIDQAATEDGSSRNDWMESALKAALKPKP